MHRQSDSELASLLLADRALERSVKPLTAKEYWALLDAVPDPASLLGGDVTHVMTVTAWPRIEAERVATLLDGATQLAFRLDQMQQSGIRALTPFSDDYPRRLQDRLGSAAPAILYAVGPASLLSGGGIGIVGSRNMPPVADEVAREAAGSAARAGHAVISGAARGVDQLAMRTAAQAGGTVVGVLADSLERAIREPETRHLIGDERLCIVTPYKPSMGFTAANAMGRNKLIYALADRTLVVSSDLNKGGTWAGATEALRRHFGDVAGWMGAGSGPGNAALEESGAVGVSTVAELLEMPVVEQRTSEPEQPSLFDA